MAEYRKITVLLVASISLLLAVGCAVENSSKTAAAEIANTSTAAISPLNTESPAAAVTSASTATNMPSPTVTPYPTMTPSPTITPSPTVTPSPTMTPTPLPVDALLGPLNHQAQIENNCGPASVAILLGLYDEWISQFQVNEAGLHEFPSPCQIARFIEAEYGQDGRKLLTINDQEQPLTARVFRLPSSVSRDKLRPMKHLIASGMPIIVFQRLHSDSEVGHYRVIHGYDDEAGVLIADDPFLGASYNIPYDSLSDYLFELSVSHLFIPVYPLSRDEEVKAVMRKLGAASTYMACPN